jgi:hypothetical protein
VGAQLVQQDVVEAQVQVRAAQGVVPVRRIHLQEERVKVRVRVMSGGAREVNELRKKQSTK